jgi:general secretion pathway protein D
MAMTQHVARLFTLLLFGTATSAAQEPAAIRLPGDSISVRFVESDLRMVIQALGQYLPKPVVTSAVPAIRVTLEAPRPLPVSDLPSLLRGLVEAQGLELLEEETFFRVHPRPPVQVAAQVVGGSTPDQVISLHVIRLKHARAADVASTVNLLFGGSGEFSGTSGLRGTLSDELQRQNVPPAGTAPNPHTGQAGNGGGASFGGAVTIVPDELTNSLLIRASDEDFQILTVAVDQLDIRPLQVLIEVLIVEARRDRSFSLNTSLFKPAQSGHNPTTTEGRLQQGSSGLSELIIRLMDLGKPDIDAALSVSESKGDVQIISRPVLLATNNSEARFLVGSQRPFVQVSRSLPTDVAQRDQVVQYRDVGTKLTVRPTINQDGYVSLFIQQEVNAATGEVAFEAPVISTREAVTQLLVRDSQTIVIGGLRDLQKDRNSSGIPVLSGLPLIGGLFGSSSRRTTATELYLFLTPRILRSDAEVDSATAARRSHVEFDR